MPIAAAVPAIIGAAGAVGGGLATGAAGRGNTSAGRGLLGATGTSANQAGNVNLGQAGQNLTSAGDFYRTLMSGNMQQIQQLLGPEISAVGSQYNQLAQSSAQLQPRSGLAASARAGLPFQQEAQVGNAILGAPLTGASGTLNAGIAQGGLGSNLFGIANQAGGAMGNIGLGLTNEQLAAATGIGQTTGNNIAAGLAKQFPGTFGP